MLYICLLIPVAMIYVMFVVMVLGVDLSGRRQNDQGLFSSFDEISGELFSSSDEICGGPSSSFDEIAVGPSSDDFDEVAAGPSSTFDEIAGGPSSSSDEISSGPSSSFDEQFMPVNISEENTIILSKDVTEYELSCRAIGIPQPEMKFYLTPDERPPRTSEEYLEKYGENEIVDSDLFEANTWVEGDETKGVLKVRDLKKVSENFAGGLAFAIDCVAINEGSSAIWTLAIVDGRIEPQFMPVNISEENTIILSKDVTEYELSCRAIGFPQPEMNFFLTPDERPPRTAEEYFEKYSENEIVDSDLFEKNVWVEGDETMGALRVKDLKKVSENFAGGVVFAIDGVAINEGSSAIQTLAIVD